VSISHHEFGRAAPHRLSAPSPAAARGLAFHLHLRRLDRGPVREIALTALIYHLDNHRRARSAPPPLPAPTRTHIEDFLDGLEMGDRVTVGGTQAVYMDRRFRQTASGAVEWQCCVIAAGVVIVCPASDVVPV
jgi:hypothetical protein